MVKAKLVIIFVSGIIGSATMEIAASTFDEILEHAEDMYEGNAMIRTIQITVDDVIIRTVNYDITSGTDDLPEITADDLRDYQGR